MTDARIAEAVAIVRAGGTIGFPTDTVYGIGGDYRRPDTVERLYASKQRDRAKPLILLGGANEQLTAFFAPEDSLAFAAARAFWPGPVTLIVARPPEIPAFVTAGKESVGLRVPAQAFAQKLFCATGPLATTSANRSGEAAYDGREKFVLPEVDAFFDDGPTTHGQASTIIDLRVRPPRIVREGALTRHGFQAWYATFS